MARRSEEPTPERLRELLVASKTEELERRVQRLEQRLMAVQAQLDRLIAKKQQLH